MNKEKEISDRDNKIKRLLLESRLKDAFELLHEQMDGISDWSLTSRFEELHLSYSYMLQYFGQGVSDDHRDTLYNQLISNTYLLSDDIESAALSTFSSTKYYQNKRENRNGSTANYRLSLEALSDNPNVDLHELNIKKLFYYIWTSDLWQQSDIDEISLILESPLISEEDASVVISAITLAILQRFDPKKMLILGQSVKNISPDVSIRAIAGIIIAGIKYNSILKFFPEVEAQIKLLSDSADLSDKVCAIQLALLMCRETQKIDRKMREEIIPTMLRNPKLGNMIIDDINFDDQNPDWEHWAKNSGFNDKIIEMTELQMEGADVYMSTFSNLKGYPFFIEICNWFRPFSYEQPDVINSLGKLSLAKSFIGKAIFDSGVFCNSDKYSFCLTFSKIPQEQRDMMLSQLEAQSDSDNSEDSVSKKNSKKAETLAKQYIQDLYRFFKLFPHKNEFYDPFSNDLNMTHFSALTPLFHFSEIEMTIAEFLLKKSYYDEAAKLFTFIESSELIKNFDFQFYQKIGFAMQRNHRFQEALEYYLRADILNPNNMWTMKHLAQCYRITGNPEKALNTLLNAEQFDKDNLSLQIQIGECFVDLGKYGEALSRFFKVEFLKPEMVKAWRAIAWCAFLADRLDQASKYYDRLTAESKPLSQDYLNSGHVAWVNGEISKAVTMYVKCINIEGLEKFKEELHDDFKILQGKGIKLSDYPLMLDLLN